MRYRKKPIVVEAMRFEDTDECLMALSDELGLDPVRVDYADKDNPIIKIDTLEGEMNGHVGDYVVKGIRGEFYLCRADIFEEIYEEVEES